MFFLIVTHVTQIFFLYLISSQHKAEMDFVAVNPYKTETQPTSR